MSVRVIGVTQEVVLTPTITASSAYSTGQALGGLLTFTNVANFQQGTFTIQSLQIIDLSNQKSAIDLVLFNQTFTAATDKTTFNPSNADWLNCRGTISIAGGDYVSSSAQAIATKTNLGLAIKLPQLATSGTNMIPRSATSVFGQLVCRGTPTYTSTTAIQINLQVYID